jgi:hypothetical protein
VDIANVTFNKAHFLSTSTVSKPFERFGNGMTFSVRVRVRVVRDRGRIRVWVRIMVRD